MTVDKWFTYWIENIVCDLAPNTIRNYKERYKWNIQPVIGAMCIADVKPMHCKAVLNRMETTYAGSTIRQAYITMGTMLKSAAFENGICLICERNGTITFLRLRWSRTPISLAVSIL